MRRQFHRIIGICLFVLGFSSIFTQIYLLREFFTVFNGNELVIGIVLSSWMLLTGFGAWLGRFFPRIRGRLAFVFFLQILLTILPVVTVVKIDLWKSLVFPAGVEVGLVEIIYSSFLLQIPFCLINGFLFVAYTTILSSLTDENKISRAFAIESIGSLVGGMAVNFILLWFMETFQSLLILVTINLMGASIYISLFRKPLLKVFLVCLLLLVSALFYAFDFHGITRQWLFPGQKVVYDETTPYGSVVVTERDKQYNFYENGTLGFSSGNEMFNEEAVHFAMVQHPKPEKVLLISGGISGVMDEIIKYSPERVDYFELNPAVTALGTLISPSLSDSVVVVHNEDARNYIKRSSDKFDVALINLPGPTTLQINRYFTTEFFQELKEKMNPGGILSLGLPSTSEYVSKAGGELNSILFVSLQRSFRHVLVLPGNKNYLLASDQPLAHNISERIDSRKIPTVFINSYYLDDELLKERSESILRHLDKSAAVNQDFKPVGYFSQLHYWTTLFHPNYLWIGAALCLILIFSLFNLNRYNAGLFTGGFTASAIEIMILFSLQVMNGYVFGMAGGIIMLFMAGLAMGAGLAKRLFPDFSVANYIQIQLIIAAIALAFPFLILGLTQLNLSPWANLIALGSLTFLISFATGIEFSLAAQNQSSQPHTLAAKNYSMDLFGSAFGALLAGVVMLPLLGMVATCVILALLNVVSASVLGIFGKRNYSQP